MAVRRLSDLGMLICMIRRLNCRCSAQQSDNMRACSISATARAIMGVVNISIIKVVNTSQKCFEKLKQGEKHT